MLISHVYFEERYSGVVVVEGEAGVLFLSLSRNLGRYNIVVRWVNKKKQMLEHNSKVRDGLRWGRRAEA